MGGVLPRFEFPVHFVCRRIVACDLLVRFGGEVQLARGKRQPVRPLQRCDVDPSQFLLCADIDHRDRVARRRSRAVITRKRIASIGRDHQFVRSLADRNAAADLAGRRVDEHQRRVFFVENEQMRSVLRVKDGYRHEHGNGS